MPLALAPTVAGIDPEVIRRVVRRNLAQISHCHEQGLSVNPQLQGRVVVQFVIGSGGTVLGSAIRESTVTVPLGQHVHRERRAPLYFRCPARSRERDHRKLPVRAAAR